MLPQAYDLLTGWAAAGNPLVGGMADISPLSCPEALASTLGLGQLCADIELEPYSSAGIGLGIGGLLAFFLKFGTRVSQQHRQALALEARNAELKDALRTLAGLEQALRQASDHNRKLLHHNQQMKESERKRIAREIHDELGQNILALKMDLSSLLAQPLDMGVRLRLLGVMGQIDSCMLSIREVINELRPQVLDLGLHAALEWEAATFARRTGIPCRLETGATQVALPEGVTVALYRIAQESLSNIKRHAGASEVHISLLVAPDRVLLRVQDDGVGLPTGPLRKDAFGLIGMRERAEALGGWVAFESSPGQGTEVIVEIPLNVTCEACVYE